jgi:hypothetical protein
MINKKVIHLICSKGKWRLKYEGSKRAYRISCEFTWAFEDGCAKLLFNNTPTSFVIHENDGSVKKVLYNFKG